MEDIVGLRKDIDSIDGKIVELFEKRMETVLKIAEYKRQNGIEILNRDREEEVIDKCINRLQNKNFTEPLEKLMKSLMEISREVQSNIMHGNSRIENKNLKLKIRKVTAS
jgi:monofunctional chorismate mutase